MQALSSTSRGSADSLHRGTASSLKLARSHHRDSNWRSLRRRESYDALNAGINTSLSWSLTAFLFLPYQPLKPDINTQLHRTILYSHEQHLSTLCELPLGFQSAARRIIINTSINQDILPPRCRTPARNAAKTSPTAAAR